MYCFYNQAHVEVFFFCNCSRKHTGFFCILKEIFNNVNVHGSIVMQLDDILQHTNKNKTQKRVLQLVGLEPPLWQEGDL